MKKRVFSLALVLAMVVGMLPSTVLATELEPGSEPAAVVSEETPASAGETGDAEDAAPAEDAEPADPEDASEGEEEAAPAEDAAEAPAGEAPAEDGKDAPAVQEGETGDAAAADTENPKGQLVFTTDLDDSKLNDWFASDDNRKLYVEVNQWYNKEGVLEDLPDYAKVTFKWYENGGQVVGTGSSAQVSTDRTSTWPNPYIRYWPSDANKIYTVTVKATCTIDGVEYSGTSKGFRYRIGMDPITATLTVSDKGVLGKTKDSAAAVELTVNDIYDTNWDYKFTVDEVLAAAHKQYMSEDDFAIDENGYVTKLWGEDTKNVLFYLNGTALTTTANKTEVQDKDNVYASVNADDKYYSDVYTQFDEVSLEREPDEEFTLTLTDSAGNAISGVEVGQWKDGAFTAIEGKTTNEKGEVTLALPAGEYLISAKGTSKGTVQDWSSGSAVDVPDFDRPIMAPYCAVKTAIPEGDVSGSGEGNEVHWLMDSATGTLTFTGKGETKYSNWRGDPWAARYKDKIKKIVFGEGITVVNLEFDGYTALEEVQLPASLTELTSSEFENCTALKTITFAEGCAAKLPSSVFAGCTGLESVTLPATVQVSGSNLFKGCTGLKEATVACNPGKQMFQGCTALEKVTFQEGVTTFGESTFAGCTALKTVYVPASLTNFGVSPFDDISNITFEGPGKDNFAVSDGYIYTTDGTGLYGVPADLETFEVPATVTTIGARAFAGRTKLTKVTFAKGSKLATLGEYAFNGCTALTEITLPDTVTAIPRYAFNGCTALTKFAMPSAVKTIGTCAFQNCGLTAINLPEGLEEIDYAAFQGCTGVTEVTLPESLTVLGADALGGMSITELVIPANVKEINEIAGYSTPMPGLKRIDIKANVTSIPSGAFSYCTGLESLKVPAFVTSIGSALNRNVTCVVYYGGAYSTVKNWGLWKYTVSTSSTISVICNYVEPTTETGKLTVESYPEDIVAKTADLAGKTISLKLNDPNPQEGDTIWADWYYSTKTPDGFKYLKPLTNYAFDSETMTTTVTLSEQAAKKTTNNWYYVCLAFKTDAKGNTTLLATKPVTALQLGTGMEFEGKGKAEDPFLIKSYEDYQSLAKTVNNGINLSGLYFKLTTDLTLPKDALQTGKSNAFYGTFDGGNHTVTIENGGTSMFGILEEGALVKNVKVQGENIAGSALASSVRAGTVQNCTVLSGTNTTDAALAGGGSNGAQFINCTVESGVKCGWDSTTEQSTDKSGMGSIIGSAVGATIVNCKSAAEVYGKSNVGGLVGKQSTWNGTVTCKNSQFTGKIDASGEYVGGIMGRGYDAYTAPNALCSSIENCYVNADITGAQAVGGIFGGEGGVDQAWANGPGYIRNNVFIGSLHLNGNTVERSAGSAVPADNIGNTKGGIFGFMRSLNMYNIIANNYYYVTNDAETKGFGAVEHIDTSARSFGFDETDDVFYYSTSRDPKEDIKAWVDREDIGTSDEGYTSVTNRDANRTDDPLGKDADKLAKRMSETELTDGSIVALLNANKDSMHNWVQGENGPELSDEAVPYALAVGGSYKTEYYIGEELDMTGAEFTVTWSDGSVTHPDAKDVTITGFDSSERKVLTLTASYGNAITTFEVKVLKKTSGGGSTAPSTISVYFTLLGDTKHDYDGTSKTVHTLKDKNLTTWIKQTKYTVDANATVTELLEAVEAATDNVSFTNPTGKWVSAVTFDGLTLEELDNTTNSGWMYTINGKHPLLRVDEQFLEDGDKIVFHWTDDYTVEEGSEDFDNSGNHLGGNSSATTTPDTSTSGETVTVAPGATADKNGEAKASVSSADMKDAVSEAKNAKADVIAIEPDVKGDASKVTVTVPVSSAVSVGKDAGADLVLKSDIADVKIAAADLKGLTGSQLTVSAAENANGTITVMASVDGKALNSDVAVTVSGSAKAGQVLVVVNADGTETIVKKSVSGKDGVTGLVAANTTVKVMDNSKTFSDTVGHWGADAISFVSSRELFNGVGSGLFAPERRMTRGMLVTVLYRLESASAKAADGKFSDVSADYWCADAITWAADNGIVGGYADGSFGPEKDITREQMAAMLYRYAKYLGMDTGVSGDLSKFSDKASVSAFAQDAMQWAVGNGIIAGTSNGTLNPGGYATRVQVAVMLQRMVALMVR